MEIRAVPFGIIAESIRTRKKEKEKIRKKKGRVQKIRQIDSSVGRESLLNYRPRSAESAQRLRASGARLMKYERMNRDLAVVTTGSPAKNSVSLFVELQTSRDC